MENFASDIKQQTNDVNPYFSRRKAKCRPVIEALADEFLERNRARLYHAGKGKNQRWYLCDKGHWQERSNNEMCAMVRDFYLELASTSDAPKDAKQILTVALLNDILRMVSLEVTKEAMPQMNPDVIPCANDLVLRWDSNEKRFVKTEMKPEYNIMHTLTIAFDVTAKHDLFDEKIREIIPDENDRNKIQEYLGAALFSENRTRMILLLKGEGSSGKSMLVKIISGILGKKRAFDLDFSLLGKDFSLSGLGDATLLSASETESRALCGKGGAWAKKLVGGDEFQASQKYSNERVNHVGFYTVIMTSNEEVRLDFTSNGQEWKDRLLPILFEKSIPVEKQDRTLVERLLREEGPGILNWLLEGAARVRANNWIIKLEPAQVAVRDRLVEAGCNSIEVFVRNFIEEDPSEDFTSAVAYRLYCHVAHQSRLEYFTETVFFKRFAKVILDKYNKDTVNTVLNKDGRQVRGYRGLKLKGANW
ncbi:MAG: hypothetical protein IJT83_08625 [Victivallales bacterium]|nr:hypothetical protein [Victivallales bacterium]